MTVQELIDKLKTVDDKSASVYMRIGGLPLVDVTAFEIDTLGDIILFEDDNY